MLRAAGERETPFPYCRTCHLPRSITTRDLPTPYCPRVMNEAFLAGTEPTKLCELHREGGLERLER